MSLYIFDTDHITLQQYAHPAVMQRFQALREEDVVAVTIITVEEQIRGRLELIRRHGATPLQVPAYAAFQRTLRYFAAWHVLDFSQAAFDRFAELRQQRIRIGSQPAHCCYRVSSWRDRCDQKQARFCPGTRTGDPGLVYCVDVKRNLRRGDRTDERYGLWTGREPVHLGGERR